ncbi:MAG: hypothetical protein FJ100_23145 [Deltaproteobacteria bacterium]|nr:hypothetical protein [Deltaproteobacteria bacterium]
MPPIVKIDTKDIADTSKSAPWMTGQHKRDVKVARAAAVAQVGVALIDGGQQAWAEHQMTRRARIAAETERRDIQAWADDCAENRQERRALTDKLTGDQPDAVLAALQLVTQTQVASVAARPGYKRG